MNPDPEDSFVLDRPSDQLRSLADCLHALIEVSMVVSPTTRNETAEVVMRAIARIAGQLGDE